MPHEKFLDIMREISKYVPEINLYYQKYMIQSKTETIENWYQYYKLEKNPFNFISGIENWKLFVGYEKEKEKIYDRIFLTKGHSGIINIYGETLIGKTSFLQYIKETLDKEGVVPMTILRPSTASSYLLGGILSEIIEAHKRVEKGHLGKIKQFILGDSVEKMRETIMDSRPHPSQLYDLIKETCEKNEKTNFLLMIDESQYMQESTISYFLKFLSFRNINIIISQRNKEHPEEDIDVRIGERINLKGISESDGLLLIKRYLSHYRLEGWNGDELLPFTNDGISLIMKYSVSQFDPNFINPGLLVKICHQSINNASKEMSRIDENIVKISLIELGMNRLYTQKILTPEKKQEES
jgi:hypothetical protein